jgi:hypothetical protein
VEWGDQQRFNTFDRCADNGGRTLRATPLVRIYVTPDRLSNQAMRYCWVGTARPRRCCAPADGCKI